MLKSNAVEKKPVREHILYKIAKRPQTGGKNGAKYSNNWQGRMYYNLYYTTTNLERISGE